MYKGVQSGYKANLEKYRDVSRAKEAITTCGEYFSEKKVVVQEDSCGHTNSQPLDEFIEQSKEQLKEEYKTALDYRRQREDFPGFD